jgi:hypothetical protein
MGKPGEGPPRPQAQAPCALPRIPPGGGWWVVGAGCGACGCGCVWVCASNKARRCFDCAIGSEVAISATRPSPSLRAASPKALAERS